MKRSILTGLLVAAVTLGASAFEVYQVTNPSILSSYGGLQIFKISRNGRYVVGTTYTQYPAIIDVESPDYEYKFFGPDQGAKVADGDESSQLVGVSDNGVAVGTDANGAIMADMEGHFTVIQPQTTKYVLCGMTDINADGTIAVGYRGGWYDNQPFVYENGVITPLPVPTDIEVGTFKVLGCRPLAISGDGSVIVGYFLSSPAKAPMILWKRQENGTYEYVDVWSKYYEPVHGLVAIKNEQTGDYDYRLEKGPNPWCWFEPASLTPDGSTVAMYVQNNESNDQTPPTQVAYFDTETLELQVVPLSEIPLFRENAYTYMLNSIADDKTIAGIAGSLNMGTTPYVYKYGESPKYLNDVYKDDKLLLEFEDWSYIGLPYFAIGISADANRIAGYGTVEYQYSATYSDAAFEGYIIDNAKNLELNAVEAIPAAAASEGVDEYYTIDGVKVDRPDKGIYIVRSSDGSSRKVVVR